MGRRRLGSRILGPYCQPDGWRIIVVAADGSRRSFVAPSEEEAKRAIEDAKRDLLIGPASIDEAITRYTAYQESRGVKPNSRRTVADRLRKLCRPLLQSSIRDVTPVVARKLYLQLAEEVAPDSHHGALGAARTWGNWLVAGGLIAINPWTPVETVGRKSKGKAQLRVDEARRLVAACLGVGDEGAVAVLLAVVLGLRASEIVQLVARDIDDDGWLLWVSDEDGGSVKSESSRRTMKIPREMSWLRGALVALAEQARARRDTGRTVRQQGRGDERLFRHDKGWPRKQVHRFCALAEVPLVSAHGLRGTHATLAEEARGKAAQAVALSLQDISEGLGHSGTAVTLRHYVRAGTGEAAQAARAATRLLGGGDAAAGSYVDLKERPDGT